MGKSEAREKFLPLMDKVAKQKTTVEITDRDNSIAVIIDYSEYQILLAKTGMQTQKFQLVGSLAEKGDIEKASKEISKDLNAALKRSMSQL
jgi:prevent-host-death family protein